VTGLPAGWRECPACLGGGEVAAPNQTATHANDPALRLMPCPRCKGEGSIR